MEIRLEPWSEGAAARVAAMVADPALQPEFERLLGDGLAAVMADPYAPAAFRRIATVDGEDAGFAFAFVLPTAASRLASIRVGVPVRHRRRGVGSALWSGVFAALRDGAGDLAEVESSAFVPNAAAEAFIARAGLAPVRKFWLMERAAPEVAPPAWPADVTVRPFEIGEADIVRFVDTFNRSWKEQDHGVLATVEDVREQIRTGAVDLTGAALAECGGETVGFVRSAKFPTRGEVAVLGVVPEWRGRGLGRALLRHGVAWLIERGVAPVTLQVDGKNDRALRLYEQEGFTVLRTRQVWAKPLGVRA